jgi:hypothetical protein
MVNLLQIVDEIGRLKELGEAQLGAPENNGGGPATLGENVLQGDSDSQKLAEDYNSDLAEILDEYQCDGE